MTAKIWFFGTGGFAARCLEEIAPECRPQLVVTAPPSVAGRGLKARVTPVEEAALKLGLPLRHAAAVNRDADLIRLYESEKPELILVIDFGQKVGEPWLHGPRCGCINIHPSLLPRYRGAAPVQRALMSGETETGVSLFRLVEKMDAGPVWLQGRCPIGPEENAGGLLERMAVAGARLFTENVASLLNGTAALTPQDEALATVAAKIDKSEARLDLALGAQKLHDLVRGLCPAPGAYVTFRGRRVKILETRVAPHPDAGSGKIFAAGGRLFLGTPQGALELLTVQPEGKRPMAAGDWGKGLRLEKDETLDA
ncbi:methionyl-tRNA formyltransferase [Pyramidobacter sp. YE332]|uniref:methionyl-tRNA formyltransferase n=1 Tax=Pyramidobacter sp. YE332 TaxID=3068894 RepID=UPI00294B2EE7|nr:methionyl-tRNA formyltransferase [Pyramidobacter sp. YE332]WOL38900.1 methionyl-tRNA formyltransferase [Pyramidobacter sp. YE332]